METRDYLSYLLDANQRFAHRYLDDITEEEAFETAGGACNHFLWLTGHLAYSAAQLLDFMKAPVDFPEEWANLFRGGQELNPDRAAYPSMAKVRANLYEMYDQANRALKNLSENQLSEEVEAEPEVVRPRVNLILAMCAHEAYHLGQVAILRRALGRPRFF
jgi:hypothetical protein